MLRRGEYSFILEFPTKHSLTPSLSLSYIEGNICMGSVLIWKIGVRTAHIKNGQKITAHSENYRELQDDSKHRNGMKSTNYVMNQKNITRNKQKLSP